MTKFNTKLKKKFNKLNKKFNILNSKYQNYNYTFNNEIKSILDIHINEFDSKINSILDSKINSILDSKINSILDSKINTILETKINTILDTKIKPILDINKNEIDSKINTILETKIKPILDINKNEIDIKLDEFKIKDNNKTDKLIKEINIINKIQQEEINIINKKLNQKNLLEYYKKKDERKKYLSYIWLEMSSEEINKSYDEDFDILDRNKFIILKDLMERCSFNIKKWKIKNELSIEDQEELINDIKKEFNYCNPIKLNDKKQIKQTIFKIMKSLGLSFLLLKTENGYKLNEEIINQYKIHSNKILNY